MKARVMVRGVILGSIYVFRGKMATGKTTITNLISKKLGIPVFRKDDIYDALSRYDIEQEKINDMSYKVLDKLIQTNIDLSISFILDMAIAHKPYAENFFEKINWKGSIVYKFLCVCSDDTQWNERIRQRILNPMPNQKIKSVEEAKNHYLSTDTTLLKNEIVIDSIKPLDIILQELSDQANIIL